MTENRGSYMEIKEESGLMFGFPEGSKVIKFDDTEFYRKSFNILPDSKGVDFIALEKNRITFIEVKNCTGDEGNCRWRISPNNQKKETSHTSLDIEGRDSLDIELPQKVAMTLAALMGAKSFEGKKESVTELAPVQEFIFSKNFSDDKMKKCVILFLEGDFGTHTRSKKMIMSELQRSMRSKLRWFNCKVSVVDSSTYDDRIFQLIPE